MIYLVAVLAAVSAALLVVGVASLVPGPSATVKRRLAALRAGPADYRDLQERRRRQAKRERMQALLEAVGEKFTGEDGSGSGETRKMLLQAGHRHANAVAMFTAIRTIAAAGLGVGAFLLSTLFRLPAAQLFLVTAAAALAGWMLPFLVLRLRLKRRQRRIQRALPDALDLLVVCVEAGLGLNQALVRVAEEIDRICPEMSDELTVVNLEIRAGTPRDEALRSLGERTGLTDLRALVTMLIQTDRFGTSVANALRVHSDSLRTKRRQRAEEAAAKTSVKMVFPLVLFIFPATGLVIVGPALIQLFEMFAGLQ